MITENLKQVWNDLPPTVRLVAVSKYHSNEAILEAYEAGQRIFGESKVQELCAKHQTLPADIEWHFIGHLQTNKVKQLVPFVSLIHSIDSYRLLAEVDRQAGRIGRVVPCLLQIHIASEETKFGFSPDECRQILAEGAWKSLLHVRLCGLMGMATNTDDDTQIRREFEFLSSFFREVRTHYMQDCPDFRELSMGMSHDYPLAIAAGSTLVRVGSNIFGERIYTTNN